MKKQVLFPTSLLIYEFNIIDFYFTRQSLCSQALRILHCYALHCFIFLFPNTFRPESILELSNKKAMGKGSYDEIGHHTDPHQQLKFTAAVIASQVVGFLMLILGGSWMGSYHGGYGWSIATVFNYHPLFMTMGMIFLYGDGNSLKPIQSKTIYTLNL